jgi:hypothetical protein
LLRVYQYKIHLNKQQLVAGTKQVGSNKAVKANWLVILPVLSACLLCQPVCFVSLPVLSACLSCQPACFVSLPAL